MFLIILYFFIIFFYFYFFAPLKDNTSKSTERKTITNTTTPSTVKEKFQEVEPELHYTKGFMMPKPAYKADTNTEDRLINDIPSLLAKSKGKNISQIFANLANDNYNLFGTKNIVVPSSVTNNYVNVPKISNNIFTSTYSMDKNDPGPDNYTGEPIFSTGLPRID
jgi:hypothetical protein